MKMNVKFTENDTEFAVKFSESDVDLNVKFSENDTEVPFVFGEMFSIGGVSALDVKRIVGEYITEHNITSGEDGVSPTISVIETENGCSIIITDASGTKTVELRNGIDGLNGKDGLNGIDGSNGKDGRDGIDGLNGKDGKDGADGYTPVKGIDYFTEDEVVEITKDISERITIDNVDPSKVIFPNGAITTFPIGKVILENGVGTLVKPGGSLIDLLDVLVDEKKPEVIHPSISITFDQAKAYEAGTKITPYYSARLNPGSYTYGPDTGIVDESWTVTDTDNHKSNDATGNFARFQVTDRTNYAITFKVSHTSGSIPVTNMGNEYLSGRINEGTVYATSEAITGYRNTFYGALNDKVSITSDNIRALIGKSEKTLSDGDTFTIDIPIGVRRVMFAYPATLRDVYSVRDTNGMNANIASSFVKHLVNVNGANGYASITYKVYVLDFAEPNNKEDKFIVQI